MVVYAAVIAPFSSRGIIAAYLQDHGASLCMHLLAPAGWLGFAPETIGRTTLGVGVLYCILLMMALFAGVAAAQWKCAAAAAKKNKERDREGAL